MVFDLFSYWKIFLVTMVLLIATVFYFAKQSDRSLVIKSENKTVEEIGEQRDVGSEDEEIVIDDEESNSIVAKMENAGKKEGDEKQINENNKNEKKSEKENNEKKESEQKKINIKIKNRLVDWGFSKSSGRKIDTIILHSSYDALGDEPYDVDGLIAEYKQYGVVSHYLIDRKGNIYRLVKDKNIAWHAGKSEVPDGRKNVNNFSIGIELMNTKSDEYTKKQYQSAQNLIDYLKKKYKIKYVLGHNDIAPGRKTDPWNFDWEKIEK